MAPASFHSWSLCVWSLVNCDEGSLGRLTSISKWRPPTVPYKSGSPATPIAVPWRFRTTTHGRFFKSPMIRATTALLKDGLTPHRRSTTGTLSRRVLVGAFRLQVNSSSESCGPLDLVLFDNHGSPAPAQKRGQAGQQ